ncbi:MAG: GDYXXLXY domain-containing protein [Saprospiraceae bacterium]
MKNYKWIVLFTNLLVLLLFVNSSIYKKEQLLSKGRLILLELAPVDPRSLMQGDYMRLRYKISESFSPDSIAKRGYIVVHLEASGLAEKLRVQADKTPLNPEEYLIEYSTGNWSMNIGAESYFFQEGQSEKYAKAKYGGIKVDDNGNSLLIGLYDEMLVKID